MKAIVANVLFGSIFGCLGCANSAQANPKSVNQTSMKSFNDYEAYNPLTENRQTASYLRRTNYQSVNFGLMIPSAPLFYGDVTVTHIADYPHLPLHPLNIFQMPNINISARLVAQPFLPNIPQIFGVIDHIFTINSLDSFQQSSSTVNEYYSSGGNKPYVHNSEQINLALGFQETFWSSKNQNKYWGVTTVEQWGKSDYQTFNLPQLNYVDSAPVLAKGNSALTFSGGGNRNLAKSTNLDQSLEYSADFEDFRGGVTYHHGIASELTLGVGFIYEDYFAGFTQLTYESNILPIKTTFSIIAKESVVDLYSHVLFQPASNFVFNYYGESEQQKFDLNWSFGSELTFTANGNTKTDSYSTGINVAVQNDFLSLSASATLDQQSNWQWNLNSQIGSFQFTYNSNQTETSSELSASLFNAENTGLKCSAFVKYQIQTSKEEQQDFTTWGIQIDSNSKIRPNNNLWSLELGYASGFYGKGLNIGGSLSLKPNLTLKLDYQEISAVSDESKIKLQLSSR
ncbi:MAG: hypothetical protein AAF383_21640 [Cyanobacteria bacterium P01_A01_bin.83]